ncbi:hypothetical protein GCM10017764_15080 [Sphingobacterium griseoflavum]|uniref:Uncharacterized protein n=2 Tax=Sphingobacterium griseoflavum TaxID=1474952 RepID=A0ABQ3HX21_9SPHI|nr:hypothetical protein GCM10017764_15080 [Sphingobacterium griseoflavum]
MLALLFNTYLLGLGAGIFAAVVMLMAVGGLCVLFFPFRYIGIRGFATLFMLFFVLEMIC